MYHLNLKTTGNVDYFLRGSIVGKEVPRQTTLHVRSSSRHMGEQLDVNKLPGWRWVRKYFEITLSCIVISAWLWIYITCMRWTKQSSMLCEKMIKLSVLSEQILSVLLAFRNFFHQQTTTKPRSELRDSGNGCPAVMAIFLQLWAGVVRKLQ